MADQHPSSCVFPDAVMIITGEKKSHQLRGERRAQVKRYGTWKILREQKAGSKIKLIEDSFLVYKCSAFVLSHEHRNAINKADVIYHYLRELLYKHI